MYEWMCVKLFRRFLHFFERWTQHWYTCF